MTLYIIIALAITAGVFIKRYEQRTGKSRWDGL